MYRNYFFLNRFVIEVAETLKNFSVENAFTQEKNRLILTVTDNIKKLFIEISVDPALTYITLKERYSPSARNRTGFFKSSLPLNIEAVEIAENDRIIRLSGGTGAIYFTIRGKYSNVYFIRQSGEILEFKKTPDEIKNDFRREVEGIKFSRKFNIPDFRNYKPEEIKTVFPIIGKEIFAELKFRSGSDSAFPDTEVLADIIEEIAAEMPAVFLDSSTGNIALSAATFHIFPSNEKKLFEHLSEAINFFLGKKHLYSGISFRKKIIEKELGQRLKRSAAKLNHTKDRIDKGNKEQEYKRIADLLLINISALKKGMEKIELKDVFNNEVPVAVKLNPAFSPKENVDYYFEKAKNEKTGYVKAKEIFAAETKNFNQLKKISSRYENASEEEIKIIMKELKLKEKEKQKPAEETIENKFKHYILDGKYNVYVGKDSRSNDLLTMKFARQNDYWFHSRGLPGSHVVLKSDNSGESFPKNILKKAASIAAFHSKAKTAGMTPVSYTLKKYVVKKKGMGPGKVALLKEEVLIVEPGIPEGAEFVIED